jgi:ribonuclease HI
MYFDGSFTLNGAGGGEVLMSPKGDRLLYVIRLHFRATNNTAKYEALVNGLYIAVELWVQRLYSAETLSSSSIKSWELYMYFKP